VIGDDGIKVLILHSTKAKELLTALKEAFDGSPFGIGLYYLLARERVVGAQKMHPPCGPFQPREGLDYRVKFRYLHDKSAGIQVERRKVLYLFQYCLSTETL